MKTWPALLGLLLAGCGHLQQPGAPIKVPVPVECRAKAPDRPAMPTDLLTQASTLDAAVQTMQAEIELREGYEIQLQAALAECTRPIIPRVR